MVPLSSRIVVSIPLGVSLIGCQLASKMNRIHEFSIVALNRLTISRSRKVRICAPLSTMVISDPR